MGEVFHVSVGAGGFEPANDGASSASAGVCEAIWFMDIEESITIAEEEETFLHGTDSRRI